MNENQDCVAGQKKYDQWSQNQPVMEINRLNAPFVNRKEKELIAKSSPKKILDIGCGTGSRLFTFLTNMNIPFIGIEKFKRLAEQGDFREYIIVADLLNLNLGDFAEELKEVNVITILGGSLNGIFCLEKHKKAWETIQNVLPVGGKIIFDTIVIDGFITDEKIGTRTVIPGRIPPQYFLSEKQLTKIWKDLNLEVLEKSEINNVAPFPIRYYLLQKG